MTKHQKLLECMKILPTDYQEYGGEIKRWEKNELDYPDCSRGCKHFVPLEGNLGMDWGVCSKKDAPRVGLLTFEHQAGFDCFEQEEE
jgi:hypothetical protein